MREYNYNEKIMFYAYENNLQDFATKVEDFFKELNINIECSFLVSDYIKIYFNDNDLNLEIQFNYDDSLFEYCYAWNGMYSSNKFKGSRRILNLLYTIIDKKYLIVTRKEPIFCKGCNEQIGWFFNDYSCGSFESFVSGYSESKEYQKRLLDSWDIVKCVKCDSFYCDCCANIDYEFEDSSSFICDSCDNVAFENYQNDECDGNCDECIYESKCHYEDNILDSKWVSCEFDDDDDRYKDCVGCEHRDDCIESAEDNRSGYDAFCDCIIGGGYDSMDDFWECNGI